MPPWMANHCSEVFFVTHDLTLGLPLVAADHGPPQLRLALFSELPLSTVDRRRSPCHHAGGS
jgi:hypothetical protein